MGILFAIVGLGFVAGLGMLFAYIANHLLPRSSPARRAVIAACAVGVLLTIPAYAALMGEGAEMVPILAVGVGTLLLSALSFPLALHVARKGPVAADPETFD